MDFQNYMQVTQNMETFHQTNTLNYQNLMVEYSKKLQSLAMDSTLQNGLLLSSPVLLEQLSGYTSKEPASFRQKEYRIEFSLLRYLTRMCFKTSPFSTFTYTGIMQLASAQTTIPLPGTKEVKNSLRLNNALFEYLKSILVHHPGINELLTVKLNKTAVIRADKIQFLVNFNNIESFQQLSASGLQLLIFHHLKSSTELITVRDLVNNLSDAVEEAGSSAIKAYLFKLVAAGLLEAGLETSGIDPDWDHKLLDFFLKMKTSEPAVLQVVHLFKQLQQYQFAYTEGDTTKRKLILDYAEKTVADVFQKLQAEAGLPLSRKEVDKVSSVDGTFETMSFTPHHFAGRQLFYEDCYTADKEILSDSSLKEFTAKADQLLNHLLPLDLLKTEREKMTSFFLEYYAAKAQVKVIDFYQAYYFHVKKPEKEKIAKDGPLKAVSGDWEKEISEKLITLTQHKPNMLNLRSDFFANLPIAETLTKTDHYSRGLFVQFYKGKLAGEKGTHEQFFGVINTVLPGMGKVSGRFLPLFTPDITADFIKYNAQLHPETLKVELNDASSFNANIHPSLLTRELALPGGNKSYPEKQQVPVNELSVSFEEETGSLKLSYFDEQVFTYDLCLESFYNRSNLYQLMAHFNQETKLSLQPFINLIDACYLNIDEEQEHEIESLPRITYENTVIIRRRTWRVRTASIPVQQPLETAYDYFIRVNVWRSQHGIPVNIFLFLRKRSFVIKPSAQTKGKKEGLNDDYKPQFMSFEQPLLVEMFKRLLARAGSYLIIEEMLPTANCTEKSSHYDCKGVSPSMV
ncbi:lantibiotic dehydratase [Pedobacter sp. NJ-S-72]